jgi:hypothetical protein
MRLSLSEASPRPFSPQHHPLSSEPQTPRHSLAVRSRFALAPTSQKNVPRSRIRIDHFKSRLFVDLGVSFCRVSPPRRLHWFRTVGWQSWLTTTIICKTLQCLWEEVAFIIFFCLGGAQRPGINLLLIHRPCLFPFLIVHAFDRSLE